jgi:twinkle protein
MGKLKSKGPCAACGSSDACATYDDGSTWCFSCSTYTAADGTDYGKTDNPHVPKPKAAPINPQDLRSGALESRGISKAVAEHFGVKLAFDANGQPTKHYYPYEDGLWKIRTLPKEFTATGSLTEKLFGKDVCAKNGGKLVVVTEGEVDALTVAEAEWSASGKFLNVVSLSSAAVAEKAFLANRAWLRSFDKIVLWLDADEPGEKAQATAIKILGVDKVVIAGVAGFKDANEVLKEKGSTAVRSAVYEARKWVPSGILTPEALWEQLCSYEDQPSVPYPPCMKGVNEMTHGMRMGEIALFVAGSGLGKSTLLREVALHIAGPLKAKVGFIALEDSPAETARKLSGMLINKNPQFQKVPREELKDAFDQLFGTESISVYDHAGVQDESAIIDKVEYFAVNGYKYIILDHLTLMVSESQGKLGTNEATDVIMGKLLSVVKRHDVWLGLVCHLRKVPASEGANYEEGAMPTMDSIKGSGSTKQISMTIVAATRATTAENAEERDLTKYAVLKCRATGLTGPAGATRYNRITGRLEFVEGSTSFVPEPMVAEDAAGSY